MSLSNCLNVYAFKDSPIGSSPSLELVGSRTWKQHQSVEMPKHNYPDCLRNIGNLLYQCHFRGITVYDTELNQVKQMEMNDKDGVNDVCAMPNGNLLVASDNGLYHYDANGK